MVTLDQARAALPEDCEVSDAELEEILAYFYFLGEQAYERLRKEAHDEQ